MKPAPLYLIATVLAFDSALGCKNFPSFSVLFILGAVAGILFVIEKVTE